MIFSQILPRYISQDELEQSSSDPTFLFILRLRQYTPFKIRIFAELFHAVPRRETWTRSTLCLWCAKFNTKFAVGWSQLLKVIDDSLFEPSHASVASS